MRKGSTVDRLTKYLRVIGLVLVIGNEVIKMRTNLRTAKTPDLPTLPAESDPESADAFERAFERAQREGTFQGEGY